MKQSTIASITKNLNARQHYSYYFKDCNKHILNDWVLCSDWLCDWFIARVFSSVCGKHRSVKRNRLPAFTTMNT